MNPEKFLTGEELEQIYRTDKSSDLLKDPNNLKKLLNYALNKKDTIDSNFDMEIVDFCVDGLEDQVAIDEERIAFMKEKQEFIAKEQEKKRVFYSFGKVAAAAAVFVVIVSGVLFSSSTEVEAGIFDWISRLFVTVKDGGEQLSFSTPDTTLTAIEREEGHLPDSLPEGFEFETVYSDTDSPEKRYSYRFKNQNDQILSIQVIKYTNNEILTNTELEINKNSSKTLKNNNITYYYTENTSINYISWIYNKNLYKISGEFPFSILEEIVSCYEKEQLIK